MSRGIHLSIVRNKLSPLGFLLVGACFLLPFVALRQNTADYRVALTWHGVDIAEGGDGRTHFEEKLWDEQRREYVMTDISADIAQWVASGQTPTRIHAQPALIAAMVLALAGLLVPALAGLWSAARLAALASLAGFACAIALVVGQWLAMQQLTQTYSWFRGYVGSAYGFWLAFGGLVALGSTNAVMAYRASACRQREPRE
jgi:hypothetical protein